MIYPMYIAEISNGVYASVCNYHGTLIHTSLVANSAREAEQKCKLRFCAQRHSLNLPAWTRGVDKLNVEWKKTNNLNAVLPSTAVSEGPRLFELIEKKDDVGHVTFEIKKHTKPLLTADEVKLAIFEKTVKA